MSTSSIRNSDNSVPKTLYSKDDHRQNLCDMAGLDLVKKQAESVACLMDESFLIPNGNSYSLHPLTKTLANRFPCFNPKFYFPFPLDPDAKFRDEYVPGMSSGFLVGYKLLLTAGHCVWAFEDWHTHKIEKELNKIRAVFDFQMQNSKQLAPIKKERVCELSKIIAGTRPKGDECGKDWALVELKDHPNGLTPLNIDFITEANHPMKIYLLGHPSGLPLKYVEGRVEQSDVKMPFFESQIDAFAGNSGSPVFDAITNKVVGILVNGNADFENDQKTGLTRYHIVTQKVVGRGSYEKCQRLSRLGKIISQIDTGGYYKKESLEALKRGEDFHFSRGVGQDFSLAFQHYVAALKLDSKNADVHYYVGCCNLFGEGTKQDIDHGEYHLREAILLNPQHQNARKILSNSYFNGAMKCLKTDYFTAWVFDPNSHERGFGKLNALITLDGNHPKALLGLAYCYFNGIGVKSSSKSCYDMLKRAVDLGDPQAIFEFGKCHIYGSVTQRDVKKGYELIRQAQKLGYGVGFSSDYGEELFDTYLPFVRARFGKILNNDATPFIPHF